MLVEREEGVGDTVRLRRRVVRSMLVEREEGVGDDDADAVVPKDI